MARTYYPRAVAVLSLLVEDFAGGADSTVYTYEAIPREVTVERNDHRSADEVDIALDYKDFPLDPRLVRDCQIAVYIGDASNPTDIAPSKTNENLVFVGHLDEPEASLDSSGDVVQAKGRDFTALFLDKKWSGGSLDLTRPLSAVVAELIALTPGADGISTEFVEGAGSVTLSSVFGRTKHSPQPNDDHWTILVDLCGQAGLIPVIQLDTLVVLNAGSLAAGRNEARFVYGENLNRLVYRRRLTSTRKSQVKLICDDPVAGETREVFYPEQPIVLSKKVNAKGKVSVDTAPYVPFYVSGPFSLADLKAKAKTLYEEAARNEIEGSLETMDLTDLDEDQKLWQIGNSDAIEVRLSNQLASSIAGMSKMEALAWLTAPPRSMNPVVAAALVNSWKQAEDAAIKFYVRSATHSWTREDGYRLDVDFVNYAVEALE